MIKRLFILFFFTFVIGLVIAGGEHDVSFSPNQAVVGVSTDYSFSLENLNDTVPITQVSVGMVQGCTYDSSSESTSASSYTFSDQGIAISWIDPFLVNSSETETFSFSMACTEVGSNYGITVSAISSQGTFVSAIPFEVISTSSGDPVPAFVSPAEDYSTDNDWVNFEFSCIDDTAVNSIRLYTDTDDGEWKMEFENTSYVNGTTNSFRVTEILQDFYKWAVSCIDNEENVGWTQNRTFSITGAGTTNTTFFWDYSFSIIQSQLEKGYTNTFLEKRRVIFYFEGDYHYIGIAEIKNDTIVVHVASDPVIEEISVGETKYFDLTNDSYYDISFTLNSIDSPRANVTIITLNESIQAPSENLENNTTNISNTSGDNNLDNSSNNQNDNLNSGDDNEFPMFWIFVVSGIVIIIVVVWFLMYRSLHKYDAVKEEE